MTSINFQPFASPRSASNHHTPTLPDPRRAAVLRWLVDFSHAVQQRNYDHARSLFHPDVFAFGTRTPIMHGLDQLVEQQWRPTWEATAGYQFLMEQAHFDVHDDLAWIAAPFISRRHDSGSPQLDRTGRATYVLRWAPAGESGPGRWQAVHSHHSLDPHGRPRP